MWDGPQCINSQACNFRMVSSFELQIWDNKMKVPRNLEDTAAGDDHHALATMYLLGGRAQH